MPDTKVEDKRAADSKAAKDKAIAEAKDRQKKAVEGRNTAEEMSEPVVEGYDETLPGQAEVVAGSPEHERELKAFPNATSYGPDVNVVLPPEEEPPPPETLSGAMSGSTINAPVQHDTKHDARQDTKGATTKSSREA
jgi:hypothetical protein